MAVILAVDQSTSGTKAVVFDRAGQVRGRADLPHRQIHPRLGFVEHDPEEIWRNVCALLPQALETAGVTWADVEAIALTNQRETVACWDAETGKVPCNAVVWQDGRAEEICRSLSDQEARISELTGLRLSPFFSAPKLRWLLEHDPETASLAGTGRLRFGTMESFLLSRLAGVHRTDLTNASRTMLMDLGSGSWSEELFRLFGIPMEAAPEIVPSDGADAVTLGSDGIPAGIPVVSLIGDSHGALFGNLCVTSGQSKVTYGTGSSIMMNAGPKPPAHNNAVAWSVAYAVSGEGTTYCMEGNLNTTGASIRWLRNLGLIQSDKDAGPLSRKSRANSPVYFLPALEGLAAPHWRSDVRASFVGMDSAATRADLCRAVEEAIAFSIADVVFAMTDMPAGICADGGAVRDSYLMQLQADVLGTQVRTSAVEEVSARGAAFLAGLKTGFYPSRDFLAGRLETGTVYAPRAGRKEALARYETWKGHLAALLSR